MPQDYWVVLALDAGARKRSTAHVYARFDELGGAAGFEERRQALLDAVAACRDAVDIALLPGNDLASAGATTRLPDVLRSAGAFRADVSGAGPRCTGSSCTGESPCRRAEAAARHPLLGDGTGLVRSEEMDSVSAAGPDRPERRRAFLGSTWTRRLW